MKENLEYPDYLSKTIQQLVNIEAIIFSLDQVNEFEKESIKIQPNFAYPGKLVGDNSPCEIIELLLDRYETETTNKEEEYLTKTIVEVVKEIANLREENEEKFNYFSNRLESIRLKKLLLKQKQSDDEENLVPLSGAIFITIIFGGLSLVLGLVLGSTFCPIVESTSTNFYLKNQEVNLQKQT